MWSATMISADAASKMQVSAGLLLNNFDVSAPAAPADEDIICETTGNYSITCVPTVSDLFADVNNAPLNTKEGKRIDGWTCGLSVTALSITDETLKLAMGAVADATDGKITARKQFESTDFKSLFWIGDMLDKSKLLVVVMDDTVSTGGISFTATNNGKGQLALTMTPHASLATPEKIPMAFYILEKSEA